MKIVFCEDDEVIVKLIRFVMRSTPHEVHIARDGAQGVELVERLVPDLVFTDVTMPVLDGCGLIAELKARPALAHIPIIVLSASAQPAQRNEALRLGATGFLGKPFGSSELRRRVDEELAAIPSGGRTEP